MSPDCARCAQGRRGTCGLAAELPPLGDRPRGSQVWCGFPAVGRYRPPFGDGPHGLLSQSSLFEEQAGLFRWGKLQPAVEKTFFTYLPQSHQWCSTSSQLAFFEHERRDRHIHGFLGLFALQAHPNRSKASQPALSEYANRQLRGRRAALGNEGKKARPF